MVGGAMSISALLAAGQYAMRTCWIFTAAAFFHTFSCIGSAHAAEAPPSIKLGSLYAAAGRYASISLTAHRGLQLWVEMKNAAGGAFVRPFNRKIPIELIDYDDQSSTSTAATLYNQLITRDKVDLLIADSGTVLTSVAVPIARNNKRLLIDQTGTGASLFSPDNPYIVAVSAPSSEPWASVLVGYIATQATKLGVKRVAMVYCTNDFTATQAKVVRNGVKAAAATGLDLVFDSGVPTETSNYTVIINNIAATKPDLVISLGYPANEIAFFRNLLESGVKFPMVFGIYPGIERGVLLHGVGARGLQYVLTYVTPTTYEAKPDFGMNLKEFRAAFEKRYAGEQLEFGFNALAGYNTGLVIEKALSVTESLDQRALREAFFSLSGRLKTLDGTFELGPDGSQIGLLNLIGQLIPKDGELELTPVYPPEAAQATAIFPRP